jgi:hypothetical protein
MKVPTPTKRISKEESTLNTNLAAAETLWNVKLSLTHLDQLTLLSQKYAFSISAGDLVLLDNRWYVTHTGLLGLATRKRCSGIHVRPVMEFSDATNCRWAFEATVYKSRTCKGFTGFGDADLNNTTSVVRGAEMRVAETRAVNRALRKAYGIGICSVEEIGSSPRPTEPPAQLVRFPAQQETTPTNGNGHLLRDQLQLLIRKHRLDAGLVKLYAADFCGTVELRQASRDQVEKFVQYLAHYAEKDRCGLQCQLNSYLKSNRQQDSEPTPNGPKIKPESAAQSEAADDKKEAA